MARGKQLRSRFVESTAEVNDWIEDQQQSSTSDGCKVNPDVGFASNLFEACLQFFKELSKCYRDSEHDRAHQNRLRDELAKLILWSDWFEDGKLEYCLQKSQELHDSVVETLHGIGQTLYKGFYNTAYVNDNKANQRLMTARKDLKSLLEKAESLLNLQDDDKQLGLPPEEFEAEQLVTASARLLSRIYNYVTCLMDLTPTLQQVMEEKDVSLEISTGASDIATFHVSEAARQYVLRIVDKYKLADRSLVERLGEANWQRYRRIQRQIQNTREAYDDDDDDDDDREIDQTTKSTFVPLSRFHDSGLGSSKRTRSSYAASLVSHTSFASTQSDVASGRLRVPPTPPEVNEGLSFTCYICGDILTNIKNRIDWKMHIFQDLEPYICTLGGCSENLVIFPTRQLWFEHELTKHRAKSLLKCHDCSRHFDTETDFLIHHELDHSRYFNKIQLQATISSSIQYLPIASEELKCPLCLQSSWTSQRKFATHLGRHMEDISLAILPTDVGSDSDAGSGSESEADSQRSQAHRVSPFRGPDSHETAPITETANALEKILTEGQESQASARSTEPMQSALSKDPAPQSEKSPARKTPERIRSINSSVLGEPKLTKSTQKKNNSTRGPSSRPAKTVSNIQKRVFSCVFSHYGCEATFGSKNEWKRHVGSQHLQLGFYRCDTDFCDLDKQSSSTKSQSSTARSYNDFNHKDLFTQHHRRMHSPWNSTSREPSSKVLQDFENSLEEVRKRCWHERRTPPQRSTCGFCRRVFEGPTVWEERMEHVGKHFEGKNNGAADVESLQEEEDEDLREWAVKEGIVRDYGARGFWLLGMEPVEVKTVAGRSSRRRGKGQQEKPEDEGLRDSE